MKKRVISVVVLLAIMSLCIFLSDFTRVLFFGVGGILCAYEYITRLKENEITVTGWVLYAYLVVQVILTVTHCGRTTYIAWYIAAVYLSLISGVLHKEVGGKGAIFTTSALAYPCFPFALMMIISTSDRVWETLALACIPCWICDAFALFGGMWWGKHNISPDVSPKKTVEGCLTGAAASVLAGVGVFFLLKRQIPMYICLITALAASTAGQFGDLCESLIKRCLKVKDFSDLIPGHGGLFDRADSLMFAIPMAYLCLYLFGL